VGGVFGAPLKQKVRLGTLANLRLRNIKLIPVRVDYSDVKPDALPTEVLRQTYYFRNCTQSERRQVTSAQITYVEGYTITKTDYFSSTVGGSVGFDIDGVKIGVNASESVNFTTQQKQDHQVTRTERVDFDEKINPYTDLAVTITKKINRAFLDFSGVVTAEAAVVLDEPGGEHGWDWPIGKLSDFLPDPTISLRGQIWNGRAEEYTKEYQEKQYTQANCPGHEDPNPTPLLTNRFGPA
jgi:hypothetical protein